MYIYQTGYTWYIHGYTMYIHQVYTWYIHWHGYTWYNIWYFPSLLAGNNLNLGEGWGKGCLQDRWPMCGRALTLACSENWENKLISHCKGNRSCSSHESSEEPERLDWLFIAIKLNSELSFWSDQKKANTWVTWQYKFTIRTLRTWLIWMLMLNLNRRNIMDWLISDCKDKYHS